MVGRPAKLPSGVVLAVRCRGLDMVKSGPYTPKVFSTQLFPEFVSIIGSVLGEALVGATSAHILKCCGQPKVLATQALDQVSVSVALTVSGPVEASGDYIV